jgi:hypothetical protein
MQLLSDWLKDFGGMTHETLLDMFVRRHFMPLPLKHLGWSGDSERASAKEIKKVSHTNRADIQAHWALCSLEASYPEPPSTDPSHGHTSMVRLWR